MDINQKEDYVFEETVVNYQRVAEFLQTIEEEELLNDSGQFLSVMPNAIIDSATGEPLLFRRNYMTPDL